MTKKIEKFHQNAPKKLVALYKKLGTTRAIEKERNVNRKWVSLLLVHGIEPASRPTRKALFLRSTPPRPRSERRPIPPHKEWWWKQSSEFKDKIVQDLYQNSLHAKIELLKEMEKNHA
jgi:hypothetical protein